MWKGFVMLDIFLDISLDSSFWISTGGNKAFPDFRGFLQSLGFWKFYQNDGCIFSGENYW